MDAIEYWYLGYIPRTAHHRSHLELGDSNQGNSDPEEVPLHLTLDYRNIAFDLMSKLTDDDL